MMTMMIPNGIGHQEDELLISWLCRLAAANGFSTVRQLLAYLFGGNIPAVGTWYPQDGYRLARGLGHIYSAVTPADLLSMTPYPYLADAASAKEQAALSEYVLCPPAVNVVRPVRMRGLGPETLRYCPICAAEEIRRSGYMWLHIAQNLPGSAEDRCPKHGVRLRETLQLNDLRATNLRMIPEDGLSLTGQDGPDPRTFHGQAESPERESVSLQTVTCPNCGETYQAHPYSVRSGMPCPACGSGVPPAEVLQHRLDILGKGNYRISASEANGRRVISVTHAPCGTVSGQGLVKKLIWGEEPVCKICASRRDPKALQKRIDPRKKEFECLPLSGEDIEKGRLAVKHLKCGKVFHPSLTGFLYGDSRTAHTARRRTHPSKSRTSTRPMRSWSARAATRSPWS